MIAQAMILKDTERLDMIKRCLDSSAPYVDGIYLTITHTTKKPSKAAKDLQTQIAAYCAEKGYPEPEFSNFKWVKNFAKARNYNFSQVPDKYEWIIWLDADDILRGGEQLQEIAEDMGKTDIKAVFFNYLYRVELNEEGGIRNILIEHLRERLIRNDGSYKWVGPIHETLIEQRDTNKTDTQLLDVVHLTTDERGEKAIDRNIEILEHTLEEQEQKDPRIVYYLAKSYFDKRTDESFDKAEELIYQYLNGSETGSRSGWPEERAQAWEYLSEIYRERRQFNKAIKANANSLIEAPTFPQYYIDMALNYTYLKDWEKAKHWIKLSQTVPYPKTTLVMNPRDMQARTLEIIFNIAINTGDIKGAWASAKKLSEVFPNEKSVEDRLKSVGMVMEDNEVARNLIKTYQYLKKRGQEDKAQGLVDIIPDEIATEPAILALRKEIIEPREWDKDEIAIVCGPGFEKWGPSKIGEGLGGSEEAVIYNGRELAKLGWKVTVYGDPEDTVKEEFDDGWIKYVSHYEFNPEDSFNVLIGWRNIGFYDNDWDAKKTYLWLHDVQNPMEYTEERVDRIDKIFVLSKAHKETIINDWNSEWLTDDKFLLTGNGINLEQFEINKPERNNKRLIWTSSYDRGLEHLLNMWPDVLEEVPEAELHIFYGWNLFDAVHKGNPERMAWKAKMQKKMKQDGIVHHGRVGQDTIVEETYKSGVWAYPTHFYEISCITAMKCQAAGAIPVVTDYAALQETVQHGVKIDVSEADIYEPEIKEKFVEELTELLSDDDKQEEIREEMMGWAKDKFSWSNVADQWSEEFGGVSNG